MDTFAERLVWVMDTLRQPRVSQSDLARRVGMSQAAVNNWRSGGAPDDSVREKIAQALNVDSAWLFLGKGSHDTFSDDEPNLPATVPSSDTSREASEFELAHILRKHDVPKDAVAEIIRDLRKEFPTWPR